MEQETLASPPLAKGQVPTPPSRVRRVLEFSLIILTVVVASNILVELASRMTLLTSIDSHINSLRAEHLDLFNTSTLELGELKPRREETQKRLQHAHEIRESVLDLIHDGAPDVDREARSLRASLRAHSLTPPSSSVPTVEVPRVNRGKGLKFLSDPRSLIAGMSSEWLLVLLVMGFGMVGGQAVGVFTPGFTLGKDITKGLLAGLGVYLIIRSGRHLFLIHSETSHVYLNPFSTATLALLAGLFAESIFPYIRQFVLRSAARAAQEGESIVPNTHLQVSSKAHGREGS